MFSVPFLVLQLTDFYYEANRVFDRGTNRSDIQIPIHRQIAKINNDV